MHSKVAISLHYTKCLPSTVDVTPGNNKNFAATIAAEMMSLGFIPSKELLNYLESNPTDNKQFEEFCTEIVPTLKNMVGDDVNYQPMYPNFPKQVMEADTVELVINALVHYWTYGDLLPFYNMEDRGFAFEHTSFKEIGLIDEDEFAAIFTRLLSSNESLNEFDKGTIKWFMESRVPLIFPDKIPYKENMCVVAGEFLKEGEEIDHLVDNATDILRIATYLSDGDVSLAENTRFKSFPRKQRKILTRAIERVASLEDIKRHRNKWVRLFHELHVGDFSQRVWNIAQSVRSNNNIQTFNGRIQKYIDQRDLLTASAALTSRPSEFARRLNELLCKCEIDRPQKQCNLVRGEIVDYFIDVAGEVPTRVLLQLLGHLQTRSKATENRVVFPKGNIQKAQLIDGLPPLDAKIVNTLIDNIIKVLIDRFNQLEPLGKVWVDPVLKKCPIPTQQRSASKGLFQVARGTHIPFEDDKNTLRFFIYWVGRDIDLSASLHDENFKIIEHISYTNLRSKKYEACHSGDIVNGQNGASEFIDITIDKAVKYGARYVAMNVFVYAGPSFSEHDTVYAGWMTREHVQSNEIYEPKTVKQKIDLTSSTHQCVPVMFDLVEREVIWVDLPQSVNSYVFNNIESHAASVEQKIKAITGLDNKVSLHNLFKTHAIARGTLVENKEDADIVFSFDGDVTPYNIDIINSEYVV